MNVIFQEQLDESVSCLPYYFLCFWFSPKTPDSRPCRRRQHRLDVRRLGRPFVVKNLSLVTRTRDFARSLRKH